MSRIRSDSGTGKGRSKTELTIANVAVLTPIARARVSSTVAVKPFAFRKDRAAPWMSLRSAFTRILTPGISGGDHLKRVTRVNPDAFLRNSHSRRHRFAAAFLCLN